MDELSSPTVEHFVKNTPAGLLILRADRARPDEIQRLFVPAEALRAYDVGDPDVAGQVDHCLVCGGSGKCPACEGTGLNQFHLPCLWCTPGILSSAEASGMCSLCHGTGRPGGVAPGEDVLPNAVDPDPA